MVSSACEVKYRALFATSFCYILVIFILVPPTWNAFVMFGDVIFKLTINSCTLARNFIQESFENCRRTMKNVHLFHGNHEISRHWNWTISDIQFHRPPPPTPTKSAAKKLMTCLASMIFVTFWWPKNSFRFKLSVLLSSKFPFCSHPLNHRAHTCLTVAFLQDRSGSEIAWINVISIRCIFKEKIAALIKR